MQTNPESKLLGSGCMSEKCQKPTKWVSMTSEESIKIQHTLLHMMLNLYLQNEKVGEIFAAI